MKRVKVFSLLVLCAVALSSCGAATDAAPQEFLPVFVVLNFSTILGGRFPPNTTSIKWYDYLLIFNDEVKDIRFLVMVLLAFILFSIVAVCVSSRKDCL